MFSRLLAEWYMPSTASGVIIDIESTRKGLLGVRFASPNRYSECLGAETL